MPVPPLGTATSVKVRRLHAVVDLGPVVVSVPPVGLVRPEAGERRRGALRRLSCASQWLSLRRLLAD